MNGGNESNKLVAMFPGGKKSNHYIEFAQAIKGT